MLSRILRNVAVMYLLIGSGLMWAASAVEGKPTGCVCSLGDPPALPPSPLCFDKGEDGGEGSIPPSSSNTPQPAEYPLA